MLKIIFLFLCYSFFTLQAAEEAKLYAILVADTNAIDLEQAVERDLERMQGEVRRISKYTSLALREKIFLGDKKSSKKLKAYVRRLKVQPNDVLLFYFSGHGLRSATEFGWAWPYLSFQVDNVAIKFEEIGLLLEAKKARLTLLFADCCNKKRMFEKMPKLLKLQLKNEALGPQNPSHIGLCYQRLFLAAKGCLMVASASPDEYSFTDNEEGSLFTQAFVKSMKDMPEEASWSGLLANVEKQLEELTKCSDEKVEQHPYIYNGVIDLPLKN